MLCCGLNPRFAASPGRFPVLLANMIVGGVSYVSNLVTSGHEWENGVRARTFFSRVVGLWRDFDSVHVFYATGSRPWERIKRGLNSMFTQETCRSV